MSASAPLTAPPPDTALLIRLGDALLPLGCLRAGRWVPGAKCLNAPEEDVRLFPHLDSEPATRKAARTTVHFELSNTDEAALVLEKTGRTSYARRPLLGIGVAGGAATVRMPRSFLGEVSKRAREWCQRRCRVLEAGANTPLPFRSATAEEQKRALVPVNETLVGAGIAGGSKTKVIGLIGVLAGGRARELVDVEVDPPRDDAHYDLTTVHYLVSLTNSGATRVEVTGEAGFFSLGEAGEVLGAVDLDADGTDELVLSYRYSEGYWYQLARWDGASRLVVIGQFGDGL
jgi:hypothetical protein